MNYLQLDRKKVSHFHFEIPVFTLPVFTFEK